VSSRGRDAQYQNPEEIPNLERILEQDEMDQMKDKFRLVKPEMVLGWLYFWSFLCII